MLTGGACTGLTRSEHQCSRRQRVPPKSRYETGEEPFGSPPLARPRADTGRSGTDQSRAGQSGRTALTWTRAPISRTRNSSSASGRPISRRIRFDRCEIWFCAWRRLQTASIRARAVFQAPNFRYSSSTVAARRSTAIDCVSRMTVHPGASTQPGPFEEQKTRRGGVRNANNRSGGRSRQVTVEAPKGQKSGFRAWISSGSSSMRSAWSLRERFRQRGA